MVSSWHRWAYTWGRCCEAGCSITALSRWGGRGSGRSSGLHRWTRAVQNARPAGRERQGSCLRLGVWEHRFVEVTVKPRSAWSRLLQPFLPNFSPCFGLVSISFPGFISCIKLFGVLLIPCFLAPAPKGSELIRKSVRLREGGRVGKGQEGHMVECHQGAPTGPCSGNVASSESRC